MELTAFSHPVEGTRLAWRKPELQSVTVSLDTGATEGSFTDFQDGFSPIPVTG
jgi:hypothetical protein